MKDLEMFDPESHQQLLNEESNLANRVKKYISSYENDPRFLEELYKVEGKLKDDMRNKLKFDKAENIDYAKRVDKN